MTAPLNNYQWVRGGMIRVLRGTGIPPPSLLRVLSSVPFSSSSLPLCAILLRTFSSRLFFLKRSSDASDAFTKGIPRDRTAKHERSTKLDLTHPTAPQPPLLNADAAAAPLPPSPPLPIPSPSPPLPLTLPLAERVAPRGRGHGRPPAGAAEEGQVPRCLHP